MSREVRRVPLDFDWPRSKVWSGYQRPAGLTLPTCPVCEGDCASSMARLLADRWHGKAPFRPSDRGSVPLTVETPEVRAFAERNVTRSPDFYGSGEDAIVREARRLIGLWNGMWCHHLNQDDVDALVARGRLMDFTHSWSRETGWRPKEPAVAPSAVEATAWSLRGFGHDGINQWVVVGAELDRLGQPHGCPACGGVGDVGTPAQRAAYDAWEPTGPPTGDAWQLWETVSEGSPVSPVFADRSGLVDWLTTSYRQVVSERPMTCPQAEAFVEAGSSIGSGVIANGQMYSGEAAVHELAAGGERP